jgi:hypothetical protein
VNKIVLESLSVELKRRALKSAKLPECLNYDLNRIPVNNMMTAGRSVINISTHLLAAAYLRRQRVSFKTENRCATIYISINIRCM